MAVEPELDGAVVWAVLDEAPDGVLIVDDAGRMRLANRRIEELFGYERRELLGRTVDLLVPEESRAVHAGHRAGYAAAPRSRPMGAGLQLTGRRRDGTRIPLEISLSPTTTPAGRYIVAVVRDISERLRAEEELRAVREEVALLEERERIARDLHDTVLQRIFATGLTLQAAAGQAPTPGLRHRIEGAVTELDTTIREIRTTIFDLHAPPGAAGLRPAVLAVTAEAARPLGFTPTVRFEGPVDTAVPDRIAGSVTAVLREALSNVARHAGADAVDVDLVVTGADVALRVADNGTGLPAEAGPGGHGLTNMRERAEALSGACRIFPAPAGGTVVEWRVPLPAATGGDRPRRAESP
ncbi:MAG TPA: PAS domain S-box protein [Acidimicrobiia bacterium]|nr:PAS domain S-box protein [Acidimicrobiia bacterium]